MTLEPGFECPECHVKLHSMTRCPNCGWKASRPSTETTTRRSCDLCGAGSLAELLRSRDGALLLCSACRFERDVRPYASQPGDRCTAPECEGSAPHAVEQHIREVKRLAAQLVTTMRAVPTITREDVEVETLTERRYLGRTLGEIARGCTCGRCRRGR